MDRCHRHKEKCKYRTDPSLPPFPFWSNFHSHNESRLQKSLAKDQLQNMTFAMFCLGDRAYGPSAFCAAGRKLAVRLVQLGATPFCNIGYGDDGTPNGGVFRDLDVWLENEFLPKIVGDMSTNSETTSALTDISVRNMPQSPYQVTVGSIGGGGEMYATTMNQSNTTIREWQMKEYQSSYQNFFASMCPATAYHYHYEGDGRCARVIGSENASMEDDDRYGRPLLASVVSNERITSEDWSQDTRHIRFHVSTEMKYEDATSRTMDTTGSESPTPPRPYMAGDIATVIPTNPKSVVDRILSCLPASIQNVANQPLKIVTSVMPNTQYKSCFTKWPNHATLRGLLTYCTDICNLPEREDLRALSFYCNTNHPSGMDHRKKLIALSEPSSAALYGDYILREKRNWSDVLFDFDSIQFEGTEQLNDERNGSISEQNTDNIGGAEYIPLTIEHLLMILSPIMPRHFSIASSPSSCNKLEDVPGYSLRNGKFGFELDLCVAVVEGETRYGRQYSGLCSRYLSHLKPSSEESVRIWVRPGSFGRMPMKINNYGSFETPVMCVGAGTGIAPLRSLIREREAVWKLSEGSSEIEQARSDILVFGCRKARSDYYYKLEWELLQNERRLQVLTAFSQEQRHKLYVQRVLREADGGLLIAKHILENNGAVYIAGGAKMARAVKDELIECLGSVLPNGEKGAKKLLQKLQSVGKFSIEAWS